MTILAIDPGAKGGIAWQQIMDGHAPRQDGVAPMPETNGDVLAILRQLWEPGATCYIEHVVGFIPGGGAGAMFTFGEGFGYLQGVLDALGYRVVRVRPAAWQKALQLGGKGAKVKCDKDATKESKRAASAANSAVDRDWKNKLKAEAQRRYPTLHVTLQTADALLLLDYAKLQMTTAPTI